MLLLEKTHLQLPLWALLFPRSKNEPAILLSAKESRISKPSTSLYHSIVFLVVATKQQKLPPHHKGLWYRNSMESCLCISHVLGTLVEMPQERRCDEMHSIYVEPALPLA